MRSAFQRRNLIANGATAFAPSASASLGVGGLCVVATCLLISPLALGAGEPSPKGLKSRVCATSEDKRKSVISKLSEIRDAYIAESRFFQDFRVKGQIAPGYGGPFTLVVKGGKRRYDLDVISKDSPSKRLSRIDDGKNLFLWSDEAGLGIASTVDRDDKWRDLANFLYVFTSPQVDGKFRTVGELCDWWIDGLTGKGHFSGRAICQDPADQFCVIEDDAGIVIEYTRLRKGDSVLEYQLTIDPRIGHNMTKLRHISGTDPRDAYRFEQTVSVEYREVGPKMYFVSRGAVEVIQSGTRAQQSGNAGTSNLGLLVTSVEVGDFDVAEGTFAFGSLPIRPGIQVRDERVTPPVNYIYKQGPIDEAVLSGAILSAQHSGLIQTAESQSQWRKLLWLNLAVLIAAAAAWGALTVRRKTKS